MNKRKTFTYGDYEYILLEDGTAEITGYTGTAKTVEIPEALNGHAVTAIEKAALRQCSNLTEVVIPDSVNMIGDRAFFCCRGLRRVSLPGSGLSVDESAFELCISLEEVDFRNSGEKTVELKPFVFHSCHSLRRVHLPDRLRHVGMAAFAKCERLTSIVLPESLEQVETGAFYDCSGLEIIECRSEALKLGDYAFWGCNGLKQVELPEKCALGQKVFSSSSQIEYVGTISAAQKTSLRESKPQRNGCRLLVPRHTDYEWGVYGIGGYEPPCYLELDCYADEAGRASHTKFFHFDIGNIEAANDIEEDEFENEADRERYLAQVERLKSGEIDYFIEWMYYPNYYPTDNHCQLLNNALPEGRTLFDMKNQAGYSPYYAILYVREERPLMPDVLCAWFERLSPALFGDHAAYCFPEGCLSREAAERSYNL